MVHALLRWAREARRAHAADDRGAGVAGALVTFPREVSQRRDNRGDKSPIGTYAAQHTGEEVVRHLSIHRTSEVAVR